MGDERERQGTGGDRPSSAATGPAPDPTRTALACQRRLWLRRWALVAGAGYLVAAVFAIGYLAAAWIGESLGTTGHVAAGLLLAAPLAVAFVWHRLQAIGAMGIEIALSQATVTDIRLGTSELETVIAAEQYFSSKQAILDSIAAELRKPDRRVIEIDLHDRPYWWSTRLYLQTALLADHTRIDTVVLVEAGNRYVGKTSPWALRDALAADAPVLQKHYRELAAQHAEIGQLIASWQGSIPVEPDAENAGEQHHVEEADLKRLVDAAWLRQLLAAELDTARVEIPDDGGALLVRLILANGARYVPIVRNGRLVRIVDADALALALATGQGGKSAKGK